MKYEVVKYRHELRQQVVELQTHLWSRDIGVNCAYLKWKYERNPYVDRPLIYVALSGGKVVGMRGMFGAKWEIGERGETLMGPCGADLLVSPSHRRRGLFKRMNAAALNDLFQCGFSYTFSLGPAEITYLGLSAMGWRNAGSLESSHYQPGKDVGSVLGRIYKGKFQILLSGYELVKKGVQKVNLYGSGKESEPFYCLDRNYARHSNAGSRVSVERTPRPEGMAELIERIGSDGRLRHVRDEQFFAWRFQNPLSQYRFLFWEEEKLQGYLILQTSAFNNTRVGIRIVDWEATNAHVQAELLHAAILWGNFDELMVWNRAVPEQSRKLLNEIGFKYMDNDENQGNYHPTILVRNVQDGILDGDYILANRRMLDLANWDLRMIYCDNF